MELPHPHEGAKGYTSCRRRQRTPSKAPAKAPTRANSKTGVIEDDSDDVDGAKTEVKEEHRKIAGSAASAEQIQKKIFAKVRQKLGLPASRAEADSGAETGTEQDNGEGPDATRSTGGR